MRRIYINLAYIVDANGAYHMMDGYPKTFDAKNYSDDENKAFRRATGDAYEVFGAMRKNDTRKVQTVVVLDDAGNVVLPLTDGYLIEPVEEQDI
ncbi:MAG: hypothetical protein J6Y78_16120 [Paludibacteraceae bacterium]|nr:hypothetical protein [Paludibacteraceae bacterium]